MEIADMSIAARELSLYCENEESIYNALQRVEVTMTRHYVKDRFDIERAIKGYRYTIDRAARAYLLEHGSMGDSLASVFPVSDRNQVAEYFARGYVEDLRGYVLRGTMDLGEGARAMVDKALGRGWVPAWAKPVLESITLKGTRKGVPATAVKWPAGSPRGLPYGIMGYVLKATDGSGWAILAASSGEKFPTVYGLASKDAAIDQLYRNARASVKLPVGVR
jgi:hypothetical protein